MLGWDGLIAEGDHEMSWNHRVVDMTAENEGDPLFAIREVHYEGGMPTGHGEPFVMSETMEGLAETLDRMKEALKEPVLKPEDFRGEVK
jgi:hypothetical protein